MSSGKVIEPADERFRELARVLRFLRMVMLDVRYVGPYIAGVLALRVRRDFAFPRALEILLVRIL